MRKRGMILTIHTSGEEINVNTSKVRLPTKTEIFGDEKGKGQLEVFQKCGVEASLTDYAVALGGWVDPNETEMVRGEFSTSYWTASPFGGRNKGVCIVEYDGTPNYALPVDRNITVRPILTPAVTSRIHSKFVGTKKLKNKETVDIVEYGMYPQPVLSLRTSRILEEDFLYQRLTPIQAFYTIDETDLLNYEHGFNPHPQSVYTKNGKAYVRTLAKEQIYDSIAGLNGKNIHQGDAYWFEVRPVRWLKDASGYWPAEQALLAGLQYDTKNTYNGDFAKTEMQRRLNLFYHEIQQCQAFFHPAEQSIRRELVDELKDMRAKYGVEARQIAKKNKVVTELRQRLARERLIRVR